MFLKFECSECDGKGTIKVGDPDADFELWDCPECDGEGVRHVDDPDEVAEFLEVGHQPLD